MPLDRVNGGLTTWPGGHAPYAYGAGFHEYLAELQGVETFAQLADSTTRRVPYFTAGAFSKFFGKSLDELWQGYRARLTEAAERDHSETGRAAHPPRLRSRGAAFPPRTMCRVSVGDRVLGANAPRLPQPQRCVARRIEAPRDHHPLSRFDERGRPRADCFRSAGSPEGGRSLQRPVCRRPEDARRHATHRWRTAARSGPLGRREHDCRRSRGERQTRARHVCNARFAHPCVRARRDKGRPLGTRHPVQRAALVARRDCPLRSSGIARALPRRSWSWTPARLPSG